MGTVIKSSRDGFRRAGLVHRRAGTFYPDGELTEQQLEALRHDPMLVVVEGVQEDALQDASDYSELIQEMGNTIAALERDLELVRADLVASSADLDQARIGLSVATSDLSQALALQQAAPGLIAEEAKLLVPEDPAKEGVICILADNLVALIAAHLQPQNTTPEAQVDGIQSTLGTSVEPPSAAPVQAVASATGEQPEVVSGEKSGKRPRAKGAE